MTDEAENHTIRLLPETRGDVRALREEVNGRIDELGDRIDELSLKIDGNTVLLNLVAGVTREHEQRLSSIESKAL